MATIKKVFRRRPNKFIWGYDICVPVAGGKQKRLRVFDFDTEEDAIEALGVVLAKIKQGRHGLAVPLRQPLLIKLIQKRLPTITRKNERTRATRVLIEWLALLDFSVNPKERDAFQIVSRIRVIDVRTPEIHRYVEKRAADGLSAASICRELNIIAATLHQAGDFFPELEQWKAPKIPRPKVINSRRERVVEPDELARLIQVLTRPPDAQDGAREHDRQRACIARLRVAHIFQFAMATGMRHSEIIGLEWKSVDWSNNRLMVWQGKVGRYKQIPITSSVCAALLYFQDNPLSEKFVFSQSGKIYPKLYGILKKACEMAGVPYGSKNGIVMHTARHTVTTRLIQAGHDLDTIAVITGHSAKELIVHYAHHSPASMSRAAAALEEITSLPHQNNNPAPEQVSS